MKRSLLFCVWLDGYLKDKEDLSNFQIKNIKDQLTHVLNKEIEFDERVNNEKI